MSTWKVNPPMARSTRRVEPEPSSSTLARGVQRRPYQLSRCQRDALSHLVVANDKRFNRIGSACNHVSCGQVSDELSAFAWINDDVTGILCHRLIVRPLREFLAG